MIDALFACLTWAILFVGFRKQPWRQGAQMQPASAVKSALMATLFTAIVTLVSIAKFHR